MVVNEIKDQIDKSRDNKIDTQELLEALEPDGFFSDSENLAALGELLNNGDVTGLDKDLLDSLEQSFYSIESQIVQKNDITDEDVHVLQIYMTILGEKCKEESREIQKIIDRHDMKKIMSKDRILPKDICTLENYITNSSYEERVDLEKILIVQDFLEWHDMEEMMQGCLKKGRINKDEQKKIDEYIDRLGGNNDELQTPVQVQRLDKIQEFQSQQDKIIQTIKSKYRGLDLNSQNLLGELLGGPGDLIPNIDKFIEGDISIKTAKEIKGINILNQIIGDDTYNHEKLQKKLDESVKDMMHPINEIIAKNTNSGDPRKNYTQSQVMAIQLWANVCHGENLTIDGKTCKYPYYLKDQSDTENKKLTSMYIYRLELITRNDVIEYRHNKMTRQTDNLLDIPELDEILSTLSIEDQDEILMDFLNNCYLKIRRSGPSFEDKIQGENLKMLLDLSIKSKTEKDVSIEDGITSRQQLIEKLKKNEKQNEKLIESLQQEIDVLSQRDGNGEYILKNMGEYYERQYTDFKKEINAQNKNNVDISHRQHALSEWNDIVNIRMKLYNDKNTQGNTIKSVTYGMIYHQIAEMYNSKNTSQYRTWMEKGEIFDPFIIKNIAVTFTQLKQDEQAKYGTDFCNFMKKCSNEVQQDVNNFSNILDIVSEIDAYESKCKSFTIEPGYGAPGEFKKTMSQVMDYDFVNDQGKTPTTYELKFGLGCLGYPHFEGGLWLKDVYNDCIEGKINLVITRNGSNYQNKRDPGELCKYEKQSNGDIRLRKYDKNGNLPDKPRIITGKECMHANVAMISAMKTLDTTDFNEVMQEFSGEKDSLSELQSAIGKLTKKYNNGQLSNIGEDECKKAIATLVEKINGTPGKPGLKDNLDKYKRLKSVLEKMRDKNGIENEFERGISSRIDQIDAIIKICNKEYIGKLGMLYTDIHENDKWYQNIDRKELMNFLGMVAIFIAGIVLSPITGGASLSASALAITFLTTFAVGVGVNLGVYYKEQRIEVSHNYAYARDKIVIDRHGNEVTIPGYLPNDIENPYYKYKEGKCSLGELVKEVSPDIGKIILDSAVTAAITTAFVGLCSRAEGIGQAGELLSNTASKLSDYKGYISDGSNMIESLASVFVVSKIAYNEICGAKVNELSDILRIKIKNMLPLAMMDNLNEKANREIHKYLTCKSIMGDGNDITMEYGGAGLAKIRKLMEEYIQDGGDVQEYEDGTMVVKYKGNTIRYKPSNLPAEYRALSTEMKKSLSELGGVEVNHETGEISYKDPEGLASLRGLGTYLEKTGQGELYIDSDGNAKLIMQSALGTPSIINVYPQVV